MQSPRTVLPSGSIAVLMVLPMMSMSTAGRSIVVMPASARGSHWKMPKPPATTQRPRAIARYLTGTRKLKLVTAPLNMYLFEAYCAVAGRCPVKPLRDEVRQSAQVICQLFHSYCSTNVPPGSTAGDFPFTLGSPLLRLQYSDCNTSSPQAVQATVPVFGSTARRLLFAYGGRG